MAATVHVPWYATGFRGDGLAAALAEVSAASLHYGATGYRVYRYRDDRYKFLQVLEFENKLDFERYWDGPELTDFRVTHSSWYQIPVLYGWADVVAAGELEREPEPAFELEPQPATEG